MILTLSEFQTLKGLKGVEIFKKIYRCKMKNTRKSR